METTQVQVTTSGAMVPCKINPDKIREVISITDDDVMWLKISDAGFHAGENFMAEELSGLILDFKTYWIKWCQNEPPDKIPYSKMEDQPEGYELRTDLKVKLLDGELVGLSMAPSSTRSFSRYTRRLLAARYEPGDVITIFRTRSVVNKINQKFTIIDFEFIPPKPSSALDKSTEAATVTVVEDVNIEDEIPF